MLIQNLWIGFALMGAIVGGFVGASFYAVQNDKSFARQMVVVVAALLGTAVLIWYVVSRNAALVYATAELVAFGIFFSGEVQKAFRHHPPTHESWGEDEGNHPEDSPLDLPAYLQHSH